MPPTTPTDRSHLLSPAPYGPGSAKRPPVYSSSSSVHPTQYSSLDDALGGARHPPYAPDYHPSSSSSAGSISQLHVSPEARYYYNPSGLTASYEYQYQPSSYDSPAQYSHSSLPPMRSSSASHVAAHTSTSHYNPPPPTYTSYSQVQYSNVPPAAQQHWPDSQWSQAQQDLPSDSSQPLYPAGRSELTPSPPQDMRSTTHTLILHPTTPMRPDERSAHPVTISPKAKGKARERAPSRPSRPSAPDRSPSLEYPKLLNVYEEILKQCSVTEEHPNVPPTQLSLKSLDEMLRSASYGLQFFAEALSPSVIHDRRPSDNSNYSAELEQPEKLEVLSKTPPKSLPTKQEKSQSSNAPEMQKCLGCGAITTPEWRRGPLGPRTLCNACGLVYAKMVKKRSRMGPNTVIGPTVLHSAPIILEEGVSFHSPDDGESDDEKSSVSQDVH